MSVFLDTGVLYAAHDERSSRHEPASDVLAAVLAGEFGTPFTSDYVFDETVTLTRARTGSFEAAVEVADRVLGREPHPGPYDLLRVDSDVFSDALDVFERYEDQPLSFTDASTVALIDRHGIDRVLSFDSDFDGVADRLDPETI